MRNAEDVPLAHDRETLEREQEHFAHRVHVHLSDVFHARLRDLADVVRVVRRAVDVFGVVDLAGRRLVACVLDDRERDVLLQSEQTAVRPVEGDDVAALEEILVLQIQRVILEFAHAELVVAVARVEPLQAKQIGLLAARRSPNQIHNDLLFK